MAFLKTNSVKITVGDTTYDSLKDFGLAIQNTDYIGTPVRDTSNVTYIPGRPGPVDFGENIFKGPVFMYRPIDIIFGGLRSPELWDSVVSNWRNIFEGQKVKITFATRPDYYWVGVASIEGFEHNRRLGVFHFKIDNADPYQYKTTPKTYTVRTSSVGTSQVCPLEGKNLQPEFLASAAGITLAFGDVTHELPTLKTVTFPDVVFKPGDNEVVVSGGSGTVTITYREGIL